MRITLVADPSIISEIVPQFKSLVEQCIFKPGHKYSEYRKGDEIWGSGLTELIVSGAVAVDVKGGVAKRLWKVLVPVLMGIGFLLKKFFRRQ